MRAAISIIQACTLLCALPMPAVAEESAAVVPGTEMASPEIAAKLFREICVLTLPDFQNAAQVLRELQFNLKTDTGTFYHPKYDLSVHIEPRAGKPECSLVNIGNSDPQETSYYFAAATFLDVPEAERALTEVRADHSGKMEVYHPHFVTFYFDTNPFDDRKVFHAVLVSED